MDESRYEIEHHENFILVKFIGAIQPSTARRFDNEPTRLRTPSHFLIDCERMPDLGQHGSRTLLTLGRFLRNQSRRAALFSVSPRVRGSLVEQGIARHLSFAPSLSDALADLGLAPPPEAQARLIACLADSVADVLRERFALSARPGGLFAAGPPEILPGTIQRVIGFESGDRGGSAIFSFPARTLLALASRGGDPSPSVRQRAEEVLSAFTSEAGRALGDAGCRLRVPGPSSADSHRFVLPIETDLGGFTVELAPTL
jgi:anti-anti-sigma regulatory factor